MQDDSCVQYVYYVMYVYTCVYIYICVHVYCFLCLVVPSLRVHFLRKCKARQVGAKIKEAAADDKARAMTSGTMSTEVLTDYTEKKISAFLLPVYCVYIYICINRNIPLST